MNKKEQQAQRARQEDEILVKVLWWIVGAVVLEALLRLLNRYYVDYTVTSRTAVGKSRLVVVVR